MKQLLLKMTVGMLCITLLSTTPARAEEPPAPIGIIQVIKAGIKKVIKAIDLKIQRLQNKTIWLQNAQKTIENTLSKLKLTEISEWTERQRDLYKGYYEELVKVKSVISYYQRIRDITNMQAAMVDEYGRVWRLLQQDNRFSPEELDYMEKVYSGMLDASLQNLDQIFLIIEAFATRMSDAKRLEIINQAADRGEQTYFDLKRFNRQNILLSLQRAKSESEAEAVRQLYGIEE
ncbi:conjugal transfer protein TraI [Sinomicrobium weinanense]|uniref:Conjugal transfer protein TraI n=1 Tax=Sinomicrobium weinanense TaxID=2842200 RepID=A0A926Q3G8_9FLAO|nr:conjugal transfer protein TraI [Sinomicrobium weinanense]MBC9797587.1 conjugal transfer protein TraI [Sinomicrobium weinanense]MBU3123654.1 conjugal transfer protein TraI [Sinomicrobium weinanense]